MITGINKSKTVTKHRSCKCECRFDDRKCNLNQNWNNSKCMGVKMQKNISAKNVIFKILQNVAAKMVNM